MSKEWIEQGNREGHSNYNLKERNLAKDLEQEGLAIYILKDINTRKRMDNHSKKIVGIKKRNGAA
jgi:hypothetical protein